MMTTIANNSSTSVDKWETTPCGCTLCWKSGNYFDNKKFTTCLNRHCKKQEAYDEHLKTKSQEHFQTNKDLMDGFKPASREQLKEWATWLETPSATQAFKRLAAEESEIMKTWDNHKWDVVYMEQRYNNMWPKQRSLFEKSAEWKAYMMFGKQQYKLLETYNNTDKLSKECEEVFNQLTSHIDKHGQIILERPDNKDHKKFVEQTTETADSKLGRRATRRAREDVGNITVESMSRAELRKLARGGDEEEVVEEAEE